MKRALLLSIVFTLSYITATSQTFVFAQLQGAPVNTTGWNPEGNCYIGNTPGGTGGNSEIILTDNVDGQSGSIFYSTPLNIVQCDKWTAEFQFRIWQGGGGADGIAFCFLDVPPTGFVPGGGVGIPGSANGLKIVFDTYNNCGAANPAIQIRWGPGYAGECGSGMPELNNSGGNLNFIRSSSYNQARIEYDAGNIQVFVNNTLYLSGFYVLTFPGYLGFTASTGGSNDRHSIRNVVIRTEMAQPTASAGNGNATCSGVPLQLGTAPQANYQYQWTPATGLSATNVANPTLTLTNNTGSPQQFWYKVGANIVGSPGCVRYDSVLVTINPTPSNNFAFDFPQYCTGQDAVISYTGTILAGAIYNWNFDGANIISGSGPGPYTVEWTTSGTKNISLSVSYQGCVSQINTQQRTVYEIPVASFTNPPQACVNQQIAFTYTGTQPGTPIYNWNWGGGTVASGTGIGPYNVSWATPGVAVVSLVVDNNGCLSNSQTVNVPINPIPTATFTAASPVCGNATSAINYTGSGTNVGTYNWNWAGGTATNVANQNYTVNYNSQGLYTVSLQVTENGCQSSVVTQDIQVWDIPTSTFTLPTAACASEDVQAVFTGSAPVGSLFNWNFNGATVVSGTAPAPITLNWPAAGSPSVTLQVDNNGCTSTTTTNNITINPIPVANFTSPAAICIDGQATINFTGTAGGAANYTWNFDNGTATQIGGAENYDVSWLQDGVKNISLTVDENGCFSLPYTATLEVYPLPVATFTALPTICQGTPLTVDFTGTASPNATLNWNFGGGVGAPTGNNDYEVAYSTVGPTTISLDIIDNGCNSLPFSQPLMVNLQPTATFDALNYVCINEPLLITYSGNAPATSNYNWTVDGATLSGSGQGPLNATWDNEGIKNITLQVDEAGCTAQTSASVEVMPIPKTALQPVYNLCLGKSVELDPGNFVSFEWSDGSTQRVFEAEEPGTYTVQVIDQYGCRAENTALVIDTSCVTIYIPNAFTPNGDFTNEEFKPGIASYMNFSMTIFNRWGQVIFKTFNPDIGWDGSVDGVDCVTDIYVYKIEYEGFLVDRIEKKTLNGTVALIR